MTETSAAVVAQPSVLSRSFNLRDYGVVIGVVALVIYLSLATTTFLSPGNLTNVLDQAVVVGLLTCGATLCIISGVFDLTATASLALSAIIGVYVTQAAGVGAGLVAAMFAGAALGALTGFIVNVSTAVNAFIATLATSIVYRGVALVLTGGAIVYPLTDQIEGVQVFTDDIPGLGITAATAALLVVALVTGVMLWSTNFGRRIYAVGGNAEAARLSGIRVGSVHVGVYMVSGICSALAGLVLVARSGGGAQANMALGLELSAIAAAVIGGTSILGGEGAIWRGMIGVLLLTLISNGFNLLGWDTTFQLVVQGLLILVAIIVDRYIRRARSI
jgi:ribose transport system permease protein